MFFIFLLFSIDAFFIEVLQGTNQSIITNITSSFTLTTLPTIGFLYLNEQEPILEDTYTFQELIYDADNPYIFTWALSTGQCLGLYTWFMINTIVNVSLCIRDVYDPPIIEPIDLGNLGLNSQTVVELNVFSGDDFIQDVDGRYSQWRVKVAPYTYIPSATFSIINPSEYVSLFTASSPTTCGTNSLISPFYPMLYNSQELFLVCITILNKTISLQPLFQELYYVFESSVANSTLSNITFDVILPIYAYNTTTTMLQSDIFTLIEIITNVQNPTFSLLSETSFGILSWNNMSLIDGDNFTEIIYTPYSWFYNFFPPDTFVRPPDNFTFIIDWNDSSSLPYVYYINVGAAPLEGMIEAPFSIALVRNEYTPIPIVWIDENQNLYEISIFISLVQNLPGCLSYTLVSNVTVVSSTCILLAFTGLPIEVNQVLQTILMFLSTSAVLFNGTQSITIQVLQDPFKTCDSIVIYDSTPVVPPSPIIYDFIIFEAIAIVVLLGFCIWASQMSICLTKRICGYYCPCCCRNNQTSPEYLDPEIPETQFLIKKDNVKKKG